MGNVKEASCVLRPHRMGNALNKCVPIGPIDFAVLHFITFYE